MMQTQTKRIRACPLQSAANMNTIANKENVFDVHKANVVDVNCATKKAKKFDSLRGLVIEVEGNLGSGKSTMLRQMNAHLDGELETGVCSVFGELINNDFLGAFYSDTKKYGFAFQMYMLTTRLYQIDEASRQARNEKRVAFLDRGAVGDTLFAILSKKLGNMDQKDMDVYKSVCRQRMPASLSDKVDLLLYLDVDPKECHRRITTVRNNEAEKGIPLEYLESVDTVYFELLLQWLGDKQGEYHTMNIGTCPEMLFLRWDKFGKTEDVAEALTAAAEGTRKLPTVKFTDSLPTHVDLDTEAAMTTAYEQLKLEDAITVPGSQVVINWGMEHNNSFKRVIMYFLSTGADLVLYEVSSSL